MSARQLISESLRKEFAAPNRVEVALKNYFNRIVSRRVGQEHWWGPLEVTKKSRDNMFKVMSQIFENFRGFTTRWLNRVGSSLPWLIVVLIKISLLTVFFMCLWCFFAEVGKGSWRGAGILQILVIIAGLTSLTSIVTALFPRKPVGEGASEAIRHESLLPYIALILLPLVAIVIANHWFGITFESELLKQTQEQLNKTLF